MWHYGQGGPQGRQSAESLSDLGAGVGVDLQPYRDLDDDGCFPLHGHLLRFGS
jgi:hypothetical protein